MTQDERNLEAEALLKRALDMLIEHFDNVQIFCSRSNPEGDGTDRIVQGRGNWYAREGQVRDWVVAAEEETREAARNNYNNPQP